MKSDMVAPLRLQMVVQKLKVNFNTPELGIGEGPVACMHVCMTRRILGMSITLLDVGCGTKPKGDVNVDFFRGGLNPQTGDQIEGEFMSPSKIKNFVVADAMHLPFKDESFNTVFSSHTIEHVQNPLLMLREMYRVANGTILVRCPHRKGSGATMPYHINYFDENWFKEASDNLGAKSRQFITSYDYPISPKLEKIFPSKLYLFLEKSILWRALKHFERRTIKKIFHIPFELEVWMRKE